MTMQKQEVKSYEVNNDRLVQSRHTKQVQYSDKRATYAA